MKYGLALPNGGADPRTLVEFAALAEISGWDGVFLEDYIVWQGDQDVSTHDPWILLAAMAMQTKRIHLGTQVTPLARRRPWKVAREAVTLDHLSNGRVILGVGLGDNVSEDISFSGFGECMDMKQRAQMLDEALEVMAGLWSGEPFNYHGRYYQVNGVKFVPKPIQKTRIPIWIGGAYPNRGPLERAARWDGACFFKKDTHYMMPDDVRAMKTFIEHRRNGAGNFDICVGGSPRREDWDEERSYIRSLAEEGITWWVEYILPNSLEVMRTAIEKGPLRID